MKEVTLAEWWKLDDGAREVVVESARHEALWPGRHRVASWTGVVALRPWADLLQK